MSTQVKAVQGLMDSLTHLKANTRTSSIPHASSARQRNANGVNDEVDQAAAGRINAQQTKQKSAEQDNVKTGKPSVDHVFFKLGLMYQDAWGSKLKNLAWTAALKAEWQATLERLSPEDVRVAFDYLHSLDNERYVDFPPTALQFLRLPVMARRKTLPSESRCYQAAIARRWDFHPIVRPIAEACNTYWLCHQASDAQGRARFALHYEEIVKRFLRGESLAVVKALPPPPPAQSSNARPSCFETIQRRANNILAIPGVLKKIASLNHPKEKRAFCMALLKKQGDHSFDKR